MLCKAEDKSYEELFSDQPTPQMFVSHYGNGDEADQTLVLNYIREVAGPDSVRRITILPGISYGHVQMDSAELSQLVMSSLMEKNATLCGKRVISFFYTTLEKEDLKKSSIVDFPDATNAYTGAIPGLYIFDNFVSE